MANPTDNQLQEIGETVASVALDIFETCGAPSDFCVQHISGESVVFGGTNRVLYHPRHGFSLDESYCTPRFIRLFSEKWRRP